ncbi:MAG TPA: NAD(P)-binding domain-containing protein [Acidimicrobiia bacterium]|jgi:thioredoxin reductase|nr:NAD(P)-binding domain-containing protein [Acidimicrobiia bacterium]
MIVVIGAGPYGLSVAAHLRARGIDARVFGRVLDTWRNHMPEGMLLKSTPAASSLSDASARTTIGAYKIGTGAPPYREHDIVSRADFIAYGDLFAAREVPDVEDARVVRVTRSHDGFDVELDTGERVPATSVIIAIGLMPFAYTPPSLATLADGVPSPDARCSHSSQHRDVQRLAGQRVAIIGAGQSALELATLCHEAGGDPVVIARRLRLLWGGPPEESPRRIDPLRKPGSPLGPGYSLRACSSGAAFVRYLPSNARLALVRRVLGPSGAWWLRERFEGIVPARTGSRVVNAIPDGDGVTLELQTIEGTRDKIEVDHVISATGYRVNVDAIDALDPQLRTRIRRVAGAPALGPTFESSVPGLYFAGQSAAATFGPLMRFVAGTDFAARRITSAITRERRRVSV